jgi:formylmethanofuran dehydrogenase subunit A
VIFFGMGLTMTRGKHANSEALLALTRDMNAYTRFVAKPNRGHGNVTGADNVVSWRTGYPFGVNHSRGYPRFNPGEYTTSDTLANGEADSGMTIGGDADENTFNSKVAPLAEYVNSHPNLTIDVGQVLFGETTSMTGDGPLGYYLSKVYGGKWFSGDTDMESGCGITPIKYKNKSLVHALQWAIGLEWYLMVEDPWRVVMSTDHPNGGSFLAYPQIIRLLMDRTYRQDILKACHPLVRERSQLGDLNREYTLNEIAIITRAGPARILGLKNKGHLGPGADADITIYTPHENKEIMFELPRTVIKSGRMLIEHGEIREVLTGKTMHVIPDYDQDMEQGIQDWFEKYYSIRWRNYPVDLSYLHEPEVVPMAL